MAGEHCGAACGFCGRCDAWYERPAFEDLEVEEGPEDACWFCGRTDCAGDCAEYYSSVEDEQVVGAKR